MVQTGLVRRLLAEGLGTGLLVAVVVGSGIAAEQLSPGQIGLQLLENSLATMFGLTILILIFGPISGAHFNPVVTIAAWFLGRRRSGFPGRDVAPYIGAQILGAISGAILANTMFDQSPLQVSTTRRLSSGHLLGEVVATTILILLVFALIRAGRESSVAPAVGAYIGSACWFTSSTSFANPAVTVGRVFSDTFAGIAVSSAVGFVFAQLLGGTIGLGLLLALYGPPRSAGDH